MQNEDVAIHNTRKTSSTRNQALAQDPIPALQLLIQRETDSFKVDMFRYEVISDLRHVQESEYYADVSHVQSCIIKSLRFKLLQRHIEKSLGYNKMEHILLAQVDLRDSGRISKAIQVEISNDVTLQAVLESKLCRLDNAGIVGCIMRSRHDIINRTEDSNVSSPSPSSLIMNQSGEI